MEFGNLFGNRRAKRKEKFPKPGDNYKASKSIRGVHLLQK